MPLVWSQHSTGTGYKVVKAYLQYDTVDGSAIVKKGDGTKLTKVSSPSSFTGVDQQCLQQDYLYVSISDTVTDFQSYFSTNVYTVDYDVNDRFKLGALSDKKDILFKDGQDWKVLKWIEKDVILDGSLAWAFGTNYTGFKSAFINMSGHAYDTAVVVNASQIPLSRIISSGSTPPFTDANQQQLRTTTLAISISDTDSGWGETYIPTQAEIKAYFYGWRMCDGTYGQPYDGTGTKTWYPIGDTDLARATTTTPTSEAPTITEGKISYYKLSYVRSTPVTEVVTDKVEGDLVVNGATQVEVGSGFTYTEVDGKRAYTKLAENARYSVTTNILSVIANYDSSLKSVVDSVVAKQADISTQVSVNVRAIAELYKRVKALGG